MNKYSTLFVRETDCRAGGVRELIEVLSLGKTPLADTLVAPTEHSARDIIVPLTLGFCEDSALLQILETVDPQILFHAEYPYYSGVSSALARHFKKAAEQIITTHRLTNDSRVLEIASNDGYMLQHFRNRGIEVLGIDPACGPAETAISNGIPTRKEFFSFEFARSLKEEGFIPDVIIANNVLAHVADLGGFVAGIASLMEEHTQAVFEVQYVADLVEKRAFDMIYHQHLCYFSLTALTRLFDRYGLSVNQVTRIPTQGGSLRVTVSRKKEDDGSVRFLLADETRRGVTRLPYFERFAADVASITHDLNLFLRQLRDRGYRIAGYGAAAKANTLLTCSDIGADLLEYVVDLNPVKQGMAFSGSRIPILAPEVLLSDRPDYVVMLAWNFVDEIVEQQKAYLDGGGQFIIPIPELSIVDSTRVRKLGGKQYSEAIEVS